MLKVNAEESLGVGMKTDGYVLERIGIRELKDDRDRFTEVKDR